MGRLAERRVSSGQRARRADREIVVFARAEAPIASVRDHRGIVGAELRPRIEHLQTAGARPSAFSCCAQAPIGADAAGHDQRSTVPFASSARAHFATSVSTTAC